MSERTRDFLKPQFKDGERPSGADFADFIDSCVNKQTDGVSFDGDGTFVVTRGVRLGDSAATIAGGLRFSSNQLQVFNGAAWTNVGSGDGGGLQPAPTSPGGPVAHDGNVGIGNFPAAPTFRLEVPLDANNGPANQVRFGNLVCSNGAGLGNKDFAVVAHQSQATAALVNSNFALRQAATGEVQLNVPASQVLSIRVGGLNTRLGISTAGNVIIGGQTDLIGAGTAIFQVSGDVFKTPSNTWGVSDARVKEDVRDLDLGLAALRQVRPVRFRFNGRAGTPAGRPGLGVLAQEIETVIPETVQRVDVPGEPGLNDLRVFDPAALTFVLINAVKELAAKVEHLEEALAAATVQAKSQTSVA